MMPSIDDMGRVGQLFILLGQQTARMFVLLVALLPLCVTSEQRLVMSFRLQSFTPLNRTYMGIIGSILAKQDESFSLFGKIGANNTFRGQMSWPWDIQDDEHYDLLLFITEDRFLQKSIWLALKKNGTTHFKMTTEDYKLQITSQFQNFSKVSSTALATPNSCGCKVQNCACCERINLPKMQFTHEICANISYNPTTIGIDLAVGVDGHYYIHEISARNPPPVCFDVPYAKEIASICLAFKDLDLSKKHLSGCMEVEMELIHMRVARVPLGCFNMPI